MWQVRGTRPVLTQVQVQETAWQVPRPCTAGKAEATLICACRVTEKAGESLGATSLTKRGRASPEPNDPNFLTSIKLG
jgi:hypothetical protein